MASAFALRLPFLIAAALIAAAVGDVVVESLSNAGIFGGSYADDNHLGIIPALCAGAILVLDVLALRCLDVLRRPEIGAHDSLIDIARDLGTRSIAQDFPLIFVLQLVALFGLESAEQLATGGRMSVGLQWLGGPAILSLAAHALVGGLCTIALGGCMRAVVRAFASIIHRAVRGIWLNAASAKSGRFHLDRVATLVARAQAPHVSQIGGRAPPNRGFA